MELDGGGKDVGHAGCGTQQLKVYSCSSRVEWAELHPALPPSLTIFLDGIEPIAEIRRRCPFTL